MLEWQEARCSDTHLEQVFWEAHQRPHLSVLPASLDPTTICIPQKPFHRRRYCFTLHTALSHLENKNTYVRMLFVDYSSAFNTIVPATLVEKLQTLDWTDLCAAGSWTSWQAEVRWSEWATTPHLPWSSTLVPRRAASLSPLLYCLYTQRLYSYTQLQRHRQICRWHNGDRPDHRQRWDCLQRGGWVPLTKWCQENHLSLNIDKTKELVVDFQETEQRTHTHLHRQDTCGAGKQL